MANNICTTCGKKLHLTNKKTRCDICIQFNVRLGRKCVDCEKPLSRYNSGNKCNSHNLINSSPF